jgi:hypothetical protein
MKSQYSFRFEGFGLSGDFASILEVERVKEARKIELVRVRKKWGARERSKILKKNTL